MSCLPSIIKLIYAGSITEIYLKEVIMRTAKSIFIIVLDCIGLAMVYIMDDDIYTFDKKKIKKIINKKVSEANLKVSDTFLFICFLILYPFVICYYKRNNTVAILK